MNFQCNEKYLFMILRVLLIVYHCFYSLNHWVYYLHNENSDFSKMNIFKQNSEFVK